jgi:L-xylulose reductase
LELGKYNIRVNSVNPTVVMTPMSAWYRGREDVEGPFLEAMPLGRWATEDEIAAPITFLLSDAASMITGVSLPIDGGYTCRWCQLGSGTIIAFGTRSWLCPFRSRKHRSPGARPP